MWLQQALAVFSKELVDSSRDRRAFLSGLMYALLGPFLVIFMLGSLGRSLNTDKPIELTLLGAEHAPNFARFLEQEGVKVLPGDADSEQALQNGKIALLLRVAQDFGEDWRASRPARVELLHDSSRMGAGAALNRLRGVLDRYQHQVTASRLMAHGVAPAAAQPFDLQTRDFATPLAKAARILGSFPIFFLIAAFVGGMSVAIDTTAGERERSSLESLLTHATPASALAVGKWAAAATFNLLSVVLTLVVTGALFRSQRFDGLDLPLRFGLDQALPTLALLLPLALMVPALQMVVAIYSKNFKEAQSYLQLLMFVPMVPGFMLAFNALAPEPWMHRLPVLAQEIQLVDLLAGKTVSALQFWSGALATFALGALLLVVLTTLFRREKIVLAR